jgi:tRNA (guanine-N7-)-methyltransferase
VHFWRQFRKVTTQMSDQELAHKIKSFVIRAGRMTHSQQKGWDEVFPKHGFSLTELQFDWEHSYAVSGPRVVEIGFGMGDSLLTMAEQNPTYRYLGLEVHKPGVGKLFAEVENIKVFAEDAVRVLEVSIPPQTIDLIQIFFPDPWHKKRHHKRRLIQPDFIDLLLTRLAPEGRLHLATDWQPYAEHMMAVLENNGNVQNVAGSRQFIPRPESRPETKFERRGHRLGHGVWDLMFQKTAH